MATLAGLRNPAARFIGSADIVCAMTISAHSSLFISPFERLAMGIIYSRIKLILMTLYARFVHQDGYIPAILGL